LILSPDDGIVVAPELSRRGGQRRAMRQINHSLSGNTRGMPLRNGRRNADCKRFATLAAEGETPTKSERHPANGFCDVFGEADGSSFHLVPARRRPKRQKSQTA
jgi:hypothetical protein